MRRTIHRAMYRAIPGAAIVATVALGAGAGCTQRLQEGRLTTFSRFGRSISISGATAAVGAYQEGGAAPQEGAVYVYSREGNVWSLQARLAASDAAGGDQFGDRVALSDGGDTLAISATLADAPGASHAGAVYVFQRSGTTWTQQAKLVPPTPQAQQGFGGSLALDGNRLVVGSGNRDQGTAVDAGGAYVFQRTGSTWSAPFALAGPSPASQDQFGSSVAVVGNTVFVGALRRDVGGVVNAGAVYTYQLSGSSWVLGQTLTASDRQTDDLLGSTLAVSSNGTKRLLLIGAINADLAGGLTDAGAAYVFTSTSGGPFTETQKLVAADAALGDLFAASVSIAGDRVLVGAPHAHTGAVGAGAAYVFDLGGASWAQTAKLVSATSVLDDNLGGAVALLGGVAFAGTTEEDLEPALTSAGTVHLFREVSPGTWAASQRLTASAGLVSDRFGRAIAASADTLVSASDGAVDVSRRDLDGWSLTQKFPIAAGVDVLSVATDGDRLATFSRHRFGPPPIGTVEVYVRSATGVWSLEQALVPDLVSETQVAESADGGLVVLQGARLVVGAQRFNGGDGRVFVYERSGSTWTQAQLIEPVNRASEFDMNFGNSVALDGGTLIVSENPSSGLPDPTHVHLHIGQVHVFTNAGGAFSEVQTITAPVPAELDHFAANLAFSGDLLALSGEVSSGTARVYRRTAGTFAIVWTLTAPNLGALAFDGDRLAIGEPGATVGSSANAGQVQLYQRQPNDTFVAGATWVPFDSAAGHGFGTLVDFVAGHVVATNALSNTDVGQVYGTDL